MRPPTIPTGQTDTRFVWRISSNNLTVYVLSSSAKYKTPPKFNITWLHYNKFKLYPGVIEKDQIVIVILSYLHGFVDFSDVGEANAKLRFFDVPLEV
jgi:hypothetical protein